METIKEIRIVTQQWYESECEKTGWASHGWEFQDDGYSAGEDWTIVDHIKTDKFGNPTMGIAEKETTIQP